MVAQASAQSVLAMRRALGGEEEPEEVPTVFVRPGLVAVSGHSYI